MNIMLTLFKSQPSYVWHYSRKFLYQKRSHSTNTNNEQKKNISSTVYYLSSLGILTVGLSYAAVPLYKMFCQAFSYGGTLNHNVDDSKVEKMKPVRNREIKIHFTADTSSSMQWNFKPLQKEIRVAPGETALAFYTAKNPLDKPITGISTYNVVPFEAGQYFNKIQCFCFEEQQLNSNEEVDMPVFFFIDPEFTSDPKMENINDITLSYMFFEAKPGMNIYNMLQQ